MQPELRVVVVTGFVAIKISFFNTPRSSYFATHLKGVHICTRSVFCACANMRLFASSGQTYHGGFADNIMLFDCN